ncbi:hypothetical protein GQ53DRAFT_825019 [Thozetella sp. PMI_491]|nr:hypothetical protein GQ53DRAFT_825019 [Thozetella sp. PMI_491]
MVYRDLDDPTAVQYFLRGWFRLLLAFGVALISLSKRNNRPHLTFAVIAGLALWALRNPGNFFPLLPEYLIPITFVFIFYQGFLHLIISPERLDDERREYGKASASRDGGSPDSRIPNWKFAYKLLWNPRLIGTSWQAPILYPTKATECRSRLAFISRRMATLIYRYAALCIFWEMAAYLDGMPEAWGSWQATPEKRFLLLRLGACLVQPRQTCHDGTLLLEIAVRIRLLVEQVLVLEWTACAHHDICAIAAVAADLDAPSEWPPLYGSLIESYTLRRYWARYWHLLVYRSFNTIAGTFSQRILRLERGKQSTRYINNTLVFIISGLMHLSMAWCLDSLECSRHGCSWNFWIWSIQVVGIVAEEIFQSLWARLMGVYQSSILTRVAGYTWVFGWHIWVLEMATFHGA